MRINNVQGCTSFGHRIMLDIGASNPKGTLKITVQNDEGKDLFRKSGYVNDTIDGFDGPEGFIEKIENIIKSVHQETIDRSKAGEFTLEGKDKQLSGVAVFVPGTTYTKGKIDTIAFMPNLRDKQHESLTNVNFEDYEKKLKLCSKEISGVDVNHDDFELIVTKDLGGCGLAISKLLAEKNQLHEGDYIMGIMTGGGFGSVDIKVDDGKVRVETSESSNYLTGNISAYPKIIDVMYKIAEEPDSWKKSEYIKHLSENNYEELNKLIPVANKLGRQGVSVKSHISKFLQCLGREDLAPILVAAGDARIVEDNIMYVENHDEGLLKEIKEHPEFVQLESNKPGKSVFKLSEKLLGEENLKRARMEAVNDYADAISLIVMNKINDCLNKVILVGPFAHGIDRHIRENAEDYGAANLPELIRQKINKNIDVIDLPTTRRLSKIYDINIICDPDINFKDNTFAGDVLLDENLKFTPNRGSWFSIPVKELENHCDKKKLENARIQNEFAAVQSTLAKMEEKNPSGGSSLS